MNMIRLVVQNSNKDISCFLAETEYEKSQGLNSFGHLPLGSGLLFVMGYPQEVQFWMDKVSYPIDIIMMDENAIVRKIFKNCLPGSMERYIAYDIKWVLEVPAGEADRNMIVVGSYLRAISKPYDFSTLVRPDLLSIYAAYNSFLENGNTYGAVVAINQTSVGWGWNRTIQQTNPILHAEIVAINDAILRGSSVFNADLYSTHMPCMMCGAAATWSGIRSVNYLLDSDHSTLLKISEKTMHPIPMFNKL
jgi:tRNA(Arg) A34 adenosine deaminase TadA/uncharacterized membrane protein (UPF0127 family)